MSRLKGWVAAFFFSIAGALVLGLSSVWLNIERMDLAYDLNKLEKELANRTALVSNSVSFEYNSDPILTVLDAGGRQIFNSKPLVAFISTGNRLLLEGPDDVLKMLALGADAVLVGRPLAIGAVGGAAEGVETVLRKMAEELRALSEPEA